MVQISAAFLVAALSATVSLAYPVDYEYDARDLELSERDHFSPLYYDLAERGFDFEDDLEARSFFSKIKGAAGAVKHAAGKAVHKAEHDVKAVAPVAKKALPKVAETAVTVAPLLVVRDAEDMELYERDDAPYYIELSTRDIDDEDLIERDFFDGEAEMIARDDEFADVFERDFDLEDDFEARSFFSKIGKKLRNGVKKVAHKAEDGAKAVLPVAGQVADAAISAKSGSSF